MRQNSNNLDQDQNLKQTGDNLSGELFENLDYQDKMKEKQKKSDIYTIQEVFTYLFGTANLGNYCCYTKNPQQCTDGSDLYSIIKYKGEDLIIKVGCGEFNEDVFKTGGISELKGLHHTPIPLFVVNQSDSYLADEDTKMLRTKNPKQYLDKFTIIVVYKKGKAEFRGFKSRRDQINFGDINIKSYENTLNEGRLSILHKEFPNGQFQECLKVIEKFQEMDFEKFYNTTYKNPQYLNENMHKALGCFWNMGVYRVGSGVGDTKAYKSLYDLIKSFDLQQERF
ncbi:MAG: hypothetical protein WAZ12_04875 [Candidatus Absconditicoccaceae bacterium]